MKQYDGIDGLVLCVIKGKKDVRQWIESIDVIDHSILSCEQLSTAINRLLNGNLITYKREKFVLSPTAKYILRGGWLGQIDWQLTVQKRIIQYAYDEEKENAFVLPQEEYDAALEKYMRQAEGVFRRWSKR